jgi:hypothetical protein
MHTTGKYRLNGHTPVPDFDLEHWATWFETSDAERIVSITRLGDIEISTVFLAIEPVWTVFRPYPARPPQLFETRVFRYANGERLDAAGAPLHHYATWAEAEAGHAAVVAKLHRELRSS